MCVICNPALAGAFRALATKSRRQVLHGGASAAAGLFIAEAVGAGAALADGSLAETLETGLGTTPATIFVANKIVMPGLIDQHLHPVLGALTLAVEVIAPEDWVLPARTFEAAETPDAFHARLNAAEAALEDPHEWLFVWGYHPLWHGELARADLDALSATRPIGVWHRSCHEFVLNTEALA